MRHINESDNDEFARMATFGTKTGLETSKNVLETSKQSKKIKKDKQASKRFL